VANVFDAMKKAQAQRPAAAQEAPAPQAPSEPQQQVSPAAVIAAAMPAAVLAAPRKAPLPAECANCDQSLVAIHDRGGAIAEEYRAIRTNMLAQCPGDKFVYVVTSADQDEGKTVTCANLGLVMAERTDRLTLLVDCDLRRSRLSCLFSAPGEPGLVDYLRGGATLDQVLRPTPAATLRLLPAGRCGPEEIAELLSSAAMEKLIADVRRQFDYVLMDSPPIASVSDAGVLGTLVGEAVLVARMHRTHRDAVERAIHLLHAANAKPMGLILTHRLYQVPKYHYKYYKR
jgi:capsular exopolysaccharide synthesis family protein